MEQELNNLSSKILKCYFYSIRTHQSDIRWFELFEQLNNLNYKLPNMKEDYKKDLALANIMTYIEQQFGVPMLHINLVEWLKEKAYHPFIFDVYTKLSDLRSI